MDKDNKRSIKPNKRLGQHFLVDQNIINQIIERSGLTQEDDVFEIGPGMGALTIPMAKVVNSVTAVEKDKRLVDYLKQELLENDINNVTVINNDILKYDFQELAGIGKNKFKVMGNLPYNISSPLLAKLFLNKKYFSKAFLMFQYEFARRISSDPGSKAYGAITVMTRYESSVSQIMEISNNVFFPKPKVGSMVISIDLERPHPVRAKDNKVLNLVVRGAFAQRRKTVKNSLKVISNYFSTEQIGAALDTCNIDSSRRAETIALDEFICLADTLSKT